jgi:hypothetical protein
MAMVACGLLEMLNAKCGFVLPLQPPLPGGKDNWRAYGAEGVLADALLFTACWLYPLVLSLFVALPIMIARAPNRTLRIRLSILLGLIILASVSMFYRGYFSALLRAMD